jgi:hypothetical protein
LEQLDGIYKKLIKELPFFERNAGRDHIFTFHYQDVFKSWRDYIPNSIFLTPETEVGGRNYKQSIDIELEFVLVPTFLNVNMNN